MVFINLEKVYDKVSREILKWILMKKRLLKLYVNVIEDMYERTSTRVRNLCTGTEVRVGMRSEEDTEIEFSES